MADERVDVVVVGMGPGGEDAAGRLAEAGLDVVGIDAELVGGECPYWGCIPSKMMIRAADLLAEGRRIPGLAGAATVSPDWAPVARRIREEATDDWDDQVAVDRFEGKGGRFVRGWGRLDGPDRVVVGDRTFEATRAVVVNVGTRATVPDVPGLADVDYWTNRGAIEAEAVPDSLVVLGGGAIGVELGQVFSRFGSRVTVVEVAPRLVAAEEPEAGELLADVFGDEGIDVRAGVSLAAVRRGEDGGVVVDLGDDGEVAADRLLVAAGRHADLSGLAVDSVGLDPGDRFLPVDDHQRVDGVERMWAIGDVTGKGAFTHMSMYQADIVVADILDRPHPPASGRAVPRVTFTDPEIGSVGLTEASAREQGLDVAVGHTEVPESTRGFIHKAGNRGFVKLVADRARRTLLGATAVGPTGGEVLGLLTLAVHAEVPLATLRSMIYAYPTFHRAIEPAVRQLTDS